MKLVKNNKCSRHVGLISISLLVVLIAGHSNSYAAPVGFETDAYYAGAAGSGRYSASAFSEKNVARVEVSAFYTVVADENGDLQPVNSQASATADSESYLEVRGGNQGDIVNVDVMYSFEIGIWRSPGDNIASANSTIGIFDLGLNGSDYANVETVGILWEAELDAHFGSGSTTTSFGLGDEDVTLTHTLSLISGNDYLIELETLAEVAAFANFDNSGGGWARAEAFADPTFSLAADSSGFSLDHFTPEGSAAASVVPIPAAAWLFGSALLTLAGIKRRKAAV